MKLEDRMSGGAAGRDIVDHKTVVPQPYLDFMRGISENLLWEAANGQAEMDLNQYNTRCEQLTYRRDKSLDADVIVRIGQEIQSVRHRMALTGKSMVADGEVIAQKNFQMNELVEALRRLTHKHKLFLQGKLLVNLFGDRAKRVSIKDMVEQTIIRVPAADGYVVIIGLSKEELALSASFEVPSN